MYILSVIPLFLSIALFGEENEGPILIAVGLLILIVAIATYNLLIPYGPHNAVNKLLQVDEYSQESKLIGRKTQRVSTIYWAIVTAICLGYSFLTYNWGMSWIIWPVAGVLYAAVEAFLNKDLL